MPIEKIMRFRIDNLIRRRIIYHNKASHPTYPAAMPGFFRMPTQPDNAMTFHTNFISDGPLKAAQNIILDKLEIVPIPNSNQAIGYLTIIDTDSNGKHRGYRHHWGLLKEDARDNDVIDIALFGGKWNTISDDPRWPTIPFETSLIHYFKKP